MSLAAGTLSNLRFNGKELTVSQQATMFAKGTISASFAVRDEIAPAYQTQIDALARDLYDRISDPALDTTLPTGGPGLFTDGSERISECKRSRLRKSDIRELLCGPRIRGRACGGFVPA
jgi:hypothetical protein